MKTDLMNQIFELTKLQTIALKNEDIDEFKNLLQKKQDFMDIINGRANNNLNILEDKERAILIETVRLDKENQEEFSRQFQEVQLQLRKIRNLKKRDTVYANPYDLSFEEGIFIDKK